MFKSKSFDSIFNKLSVNILHEKKNKSFNNFNILTKKGKQSYISYGEYMNKNIYNKIPKVKRQKIIHYYYKNLLSNL